jgi:hypothetical protein
MTNRFQFQNINIQTKEDGSVCDFAIDNWSLFVICLLGFGIFFAKKQQIIRKPLWIDYTYWILSGGVRKLVSAFYATTSRRTPKISSFTLERNSINFIQIRFMQRLLITLGLILLLIGLLWPFLSKLPTGRLPGDISISKPGLKIFFPVTTMILISLLLSLFLWIFRK